MDARHRPAAGRPGLLLCLVGLWLLGATAPALAWGDRAHRIVAGVAEERLDEAARRLVDELAGPDGLAGLAVWADRIRAQRPETAPWHYVNIPLGDAAYEHRRHCARPTPGDCVVAAIERFGGLLADRDAPPAARAEALAFLVHFVADIHQPLHCVAEARGGNDIQVMLPGQPHHPVTGDPWTLHAVWDAGFLEQTGWRDADLRRRVRDWIASDPVGGTMSDDPADWAMESHRLAADILGGLTPSGELREQDVQAALEAVVRQLARAAVRLAQRLTAALSPVGPP